MTSTHRPGTRTDTDRVPGGDADQVPGGDADQVPGGDAEKPTEIPAKGWLQVVKRGWKESSADQVPLLGAGVAFYAFLALFPALIAVVSLYGLFADPAAIGTQINSMTSALPEQARTLITDQVTALTTRGRATLGIGLILSVALALWSASSGVSNLITAINSAYDEDEERGFVKKRLLALAITVAAIVFMVIMLGLVAVVPPLLEHLVGDSPLRWILQIGRWLVLILLVTGALAVLYRLARTVPPPRCAGFPSAPSPPPSYGWSPRSASRCTCRPSATTPRPTASSPASS